MKQVYIIDDEESILEALKYMFLEEGYEVTISSHGDDLLKSDGKLPDIIILDVLLSGKDGRDIAKKLKNTDKTRRIPIIMMSAHPNAGIMIRECGADDFLAKPFNTSDLLGVVEKYCMEKNSHCK